MRKGELFLILVEGRISVPTTRFTKYRGLSAKSLEEKEFQRMSQNESISGPKL